MSFKCKVCGESVRACNDGSIDELTMLQTHLDCLTKFRGIGKEELLSNRFTKMTYTKIKNAKDIAEINAIKGFEYKDLFEEETEIVKQLAFCKQNLELLSNTDIEALYKKLNYLKEVCKA